MKILTTFSLFAFLHLVGWGLAHAWLKKNPHETLLVFDTSFSMKSHFDDMWQWAGDYAANNRYTRIVVGTDKQEIGEYNTRLSQGVVLKSAFGKFSSESLDKYKAVRNDKKILLSNGEVTPENWELIVFR